MKSNYSQYTVGSPIHRLVEIRIVEDDVGALASKLKSNGLEIALCGRLHDLASNESAAGKGNLVYFHVRTYGSSDSMSVTGEDVDGTWWKASFLDQAAHADRCQWCEFGRLR